ncbi:MAG: sodium:solute symporter family protein [Thermoplasmata archaeon]|jgi:SSS family solute:Na+ symporter|nr:sodium:solute symporter family protein [Thermoplasmata archaeon]
MDALSLGFFVVYLSSLMGIAVYARMRSKRTSEDYFVASRSIGPVVLFLSLAATNFSAFTFFGFAGAAYKFGLAYYGIMAFGTGFMALAFYFIGRKVWRLGKEKGYITPPELIGDRFKSDTLRMVFLSVMVVFTLPYLATQAIGGGIALEQLTEGEISYEMGAVIVTMVVIAYVTVGGMRGDAYTDVLQGVMMLVTLLAAVGIVAYGLGGFTEANSRLADEFPDLVSRPGGRDFFTPQVWFSYMLLWILCDPMFPQLFTRFYSARDEKAIRFSTMMYAPITAVIFLCPVLIGAWGNLQFPGLTGTQPDNILPMMVDEFAPSWVLGIMLSGAFAALMSTADSQLLVLSSMLTRDVYKRWVKRTASLTEEFVVGKVLVVGLALVGLAIALSSVETLFETLTKTTFTGLAVLFPTTVAALYWPKATKWGCISSIVAGELVYTAFYFKVFPADWTFGFLSVVPVILVAVAALVLVSYATRASPPETGEVSAQS